jgi:hypothetical protein
MKNLGILRRISYLLPTFILKNLYHALIQPYLSYCNFIWSSTYPTHLSTSNILQKKLSALSLSHLTTHKPNRSLKILRFLKSNKLDLSKHVNLCSSMPTICYLLPSCHFLPQYHQLLLPEVTVLLYVNMPEPTLVNFLYSTRDRYCGIICPKTSKLLTAFHNSKDLFVPIH